MYLVRTTFTPPLGMAPDERAMLASDEAAAALRLQSSGILVQLWRDTETGSAWGVWAVDSREGLSTAMSQLPCLPYMAVEPHPIIDHPNRMPEGR